MSQIFDTNVEPSTAGYDLGTALRYWDAYLGNILALQTLVAQGIAAPALSAAGAGKIYFDSSSNKFQASQNGGAYVDMVGTAPPFIDTQTVIKGSADATKLLRIEVDGLTTATTRVWTAADANITVAGINFAQSWTANQTYAANILASGSRDIGATSGGFANGYFTTLSTQAVRIATAGSSFGTYWNLTLASATQFDVVNNSSAVVFSFTAAGNHSTTRPIVPNANNTLALGATATAWSKVWTTDLSVAGVVSSNLIASGAVNLGSTSAPWANAYAANVFCNKTIISDTANFAAYWQIEVPSGQSTLVWRLLDNAGALFLYCNANTGVTPSTRQFNVSADFTPNSDNTYGIGTTAFRWSILWSRLANIGISGTGGYIDFEGTAPAPALSAAGKCRMYYDSAGNKLKISENGGVYANVV